MKNRQTVQGESKVFFLWVKGPKAAIVEVGDNPAREDSPSGEEPSPSQTVDKILHHLGCF